MATIYDVARAAGVTAATVSVALSGRGVVNHKTRERILRCAQELGYRPNLVARSLTMRRTDTIALVVYRITNPYYAEAALAVEQNAQRAGYRVFFANTNGDVALGTELLEDLAARQVDGIIVLPGGVPADAVRATAATGLPMVACSWGEEAGPDLIPAVSVDFGAGGRQVADHLLDLGHRRIGALGSRIFGETGLRAREATFRDRLAERGCPLDETLVADGDDDTETGYAATHTLLALSNPPTAIYAANDLMAMGAIAAAHERGLRVPEDLSVVGFDDISFARYLTPPLTTVRIERTELMAIAVATLLRLIAGEEASAREPLTPSLIVRASTAPPARSDQA
jgi:DNA-binding LacI/PurR family transcriptional regulator